MLRAVLLALAALASAGALAQGTVEVNIEQYKFAPRELKVKAGTTVKWINNEKRASHSVLFPDEGGLESDRMMPGDSWQRTFLKPGRYRYGCGPHPEMSGVVEVTE